MLDLVGVPLVSLGVFCSAKSREEKPVVEDVRWAKGGLRVYVSCRKYTRAFNIIPITLDACRAHTASW